MRIPPNEPHSQYPPPQPPNTLLYASNAVAICFAFLAASSLLPAPFGDGFDIFLAYFMTAIFCLWRNWAVYVVHRNLLKQHYQIQAWMSEYYSSTLNPVEDADWPPPIHAVNAAQEPAILLPNDETLGRIRRDRLFGIAWSIAFISLGPFGLMTSLSRDGLTPLNVISALSMALTAILSYRVANSVYDYRLRKHSFLLALQQQDAQQEPIK